MWRHTGKVVTWSDWCDCHRRTDHPADLIMFTRVNSVYPITNETNSGWLKSSLFGFRMGERYFLNLLLRFSKKCSFVWECSRGSDQTRQINLKKFYTQDFKVENLGRVHNRRNRINHFKKWHLFSYVYIIFKVNTIAGKILHTMSKHYFTYTILLNNDLATH